MLLKRILRVSFDSAMESSTTVKLKDAVVSPCGNVTVRGRESTSSSEADVLQTVRCTSSSTVFGSGLLSSTCNSTLSPSFTSEERVTNLATAGTNPGGSSSPASTVLSSTTSLSTDLSSLSVMVISWVGNAPRFKPSGTSLMARVIVSVASTSASSVATSHKRLTFSPGSKVTEPGISTSSPIVPVPDPFKDTVIGCENSLLSLTCRARPVSTPSITPLVECPKLTVGSINSGSSTFRV